MTRNKFNQKRVTQSSFKKESTNNNNNLSDNTIDLVTPNSKPNQKHSFKQLDSTNLENFNEQQEVDEAE